MASPTAIPNPSASSHHQPSTPPPSSSANAFSRSPTGTNPNPLVSPIYTSAGRSAFSLPGPNSNSTSPTTTSWYSAGFASNNSQRVRSPTASFAPMPPSNASNNVAPQKDYFVESNAGPMSAHYRTASFGSASQSSSISSNDLMNEPTTPKATEASLPGGRIPPLGTSFENIKGHRASWQAHAGANWNGLNGMRGVPSNDATAASAPPPNAAPPSGGMGGIFRKFSFGSGSQSPMKMAPPSSTSVNGIKNSPPSAAAAPIPASAPVTVASPTMEPVAVETVVRGRQASMNGGKRRPSPMGERLLMGHFNAH